MTFLSDTSIGFPGLGIEIDPPAGFTVFGLEIRLYAVMIVFGIILAVLYASRRSRAFGLVPDNVIDIVLVSLPCAVVGARAFYVISEWDVFFAPGVPWYECITGIRNGGLAIYGGVIGASVGLLVYFLTSKKRRARLLPSFDLCGLGLLIGQAVGRWGNFFNREAFGAYTDNLFAMRLSDKVLPAVTAKTPKALAEQIELVKRMAAEGGYVGQIQVHPTFLYESVWNLVGLLLLHLLSKRRKFDGEIILGYVAWYGLGRAWIEGLRLDSLTEGSIRVSQLIAIVSCIIAAAALVYIRFVRKPDPAHMLVNRCAAEAQEEYKKEEP